jgi:hypothetical protein
MELTNGIQHAQIFMFLFDIFTVRIPYPHISKKLVLVVVVMISIPEIRRQFLAAIHFPGMEKLKDMVILRVNAFVTPMVVGA